MKTLYFDCFSGISGNMILGALISAGFRKEELNSALKGIKIKNFNLIIKNVMRNGISAVHFQVKCTGDPKRHVPYGEIVELLKRGRLKKEVKERALEIFDNLANAEARVHGCRKTDVEFHEIGAADAIIDIIGSIAGFEYFGIEKFFSSELPFNTGSVKSMHGNLPLPAPAVLELLREAPLKRVDYHGELVTPTGAAIIKTLCSGFGFPEEMWIERTGYGAGDYPDTPLPDVLRILIGRSERFTEGTVWVIETNIDDMNPQLFENLIECLLKSGALDVYITNVIMKKGRPGFLLTVLVEEDKKQFIEKEIFRNTTTIGLRMYPVKRSVLERKIVTRKISGVDVRFKHSYFEGREVNAVPEYEDVKKLAAKKKVTLKDAYKMLSGVKFIR